MLGQSPALGERKIWKEKLQLLIFGKFILSKYLTVCF